MLVERGGTAQHFVLGVYAQFVAAIVPVHRKSSIKSCVKKKFGCGFSGRNHAVGQSIARHVWYV